MKGISYIQDAAKGLVKEVSCKFSADARLLNPHLCPTLPPTTSTLPFINYAEQINFPGDESV